MITATYKRDYNGKLLYLPKERNWFEIVLAGVTPRLKYLNVNKL